MSEDLATSALKGASPGDPPVDWVLSPDRRRLTITKVVDRVKITYTLGWTFDPIESSPRLKPGDSWLRQPGPDAPALVLRPQHQQGRNRP